MKDNPWFDKEVRKLLRKKNSLFKEYKILLEDSKENTKIIDNTFSQYKEANQNCDYTARKIKKKILQQLKKCYGSS